MKLFNKAALGLMALALPLFTACVEDETHNADTEINVVKIENIEDSYSAIANLDTVVIEPKVTGSLYGEDESNYRYEWTINVSTNPEVITNEVITTEKNLVYPVKQDPGSYTIIFRVYDKNNKMEYEKSTVIRSTTPFVKGYYLYGAKEDGLAAMDFVSFLGSDTTFVRDVFKNEKQLKNPKNLIYMGYYYSDFLCNLWATSEDDYAEVESSPNIAEISCMDTDVEKICFSSLSGVQHPMKFVDMHPHAAENKNNNCNSRTRIVFTENEMFGNMFYSGPEMYGNPFNRYATSGADGEILFKPAPYAFYVPTTIAGITNFMYYDLTNHMFCGTWMVYSAPKSCTKFDPSSDILQEGLFYWDQKKYDSVRDLIFGYNSIYNKRSYALMKDTEGKMYVYQFSVGASSSASRKLAGYDINMDIATDLDKATHYAFFSGQPYMIYAAGSKLYVIDYSRNKCEMVKDFGDEITYLAMDLSSEGKYTQFRVATYSATNKGNIYKYQIADDVNAIKVAPLADHWKTDLKVVKIEYRNSAYGKKNY